MAEKKAFYLTTTLPYVNADPHIGFALEIVHADSIARYKRLMGHEVFFTTGTDEHGQKIFEKAKEQGQDVQAYVDHFAARFETLKKSLGLSNDAFIRTTDPLHVAAAQEIWKRCVEVGDIYKKKYRGLYCVGDEAFLKPSDLVDGKCPNHPNMDLVEIEEENYFFKLSAYQDKLLDYLSNPDVILPDWRRDEAIKFVQGGLEDFSISREKARMSWGVPVPDDDTQVMYVWFDALTNYISVLGWPEDREGKFKKFWTDGEVVQMAGKDQVRFQSIMWQAMLMSAKIKTTDKVVYHGFINSGGQKMSKSLGNVIGPFEIVEEYGTDALRYFLARHVHPFDDSDVTMEKFKEVYNANLANGLGNLVSRVTKLASDNLDVGTRPEVAGFPSEYTDAVEKYELNKAMDYIWSRIGALDERITREEPYKLVKTDKAAAQKIIFEMTQELYLIGRMLNPFMPDTNAKIKQAIVENRKPENLFARKD